MTAIELLRRCGGSLETDWYSLSISQKADCLALAKQFRYRQTPQQRAMGRSRAYSFYLSLQRKAARQVKGY